MLYILYSKIKPSRLNDMRAKVLHASCSNRFPKTFGLCNWKYGKSQEGIDYDCGCCL